MDIEYTKTRIWQDASKLAAKDFNSFRAVLRELLDIDFQYRAIVSENERAKEALFIAHSPAL